MTILADPPPVHFMSFAAETVRSISREF